MLVQAIHTVVRGRARYKVPRLYRSASFKKELEFRLLNKEGIYQVSANILTGNVLVIFNSDNTVSEVATLIEGIVLEYGDQETGQLKNSSSQDLRGESIGRENLPLSSFPAKDTRGFGPSSENGGITSSLSRSPIAEKRADLGLRSLPALRKTLERLIAPAEEQSLEPWHLMNAEEVIAAFKTSRISGLSEESAKERLKTYGPNVLPESVPRSGLSIFFDQLNTLPVALLTVAAGVSIFTGGLADALVILGVVAINATIGYITETQSEKTIHSLKNLVRPSALVIRDGVTREIKAEEVVPGDILVLRPGSYVVADGRLIESHRLSVDESTLTGESVPVLKTPQPILTQKPVPLADRVNMVYMGTLVTGGQGLAVVVATGRFTEMGQIQTLVGEAETPETPMERQLNRMGRQLVLISGTICGLVFAIGLLRGYGFIQMLTTSISLAVAAVPEGLPTVATTTLALGIRNMRKHKVLIRHLDAVETLGSIQTLCLDKTGTITLNKMSVVAIYTGMKSLRVCEGKFVMGREPINPFTCEELGRLIRISALCNETEILKTENEYVLKGSPTENALVYLGISAGIDVIELREAYPVLKIGYRSENCNFMSTLHMTPKIGESDKSSLLLAVKGSPPEVLAMCDWQIKEGVKVPLTEEDRLRIEMENELMAGEALRVLGVAQRYFEEGEGDLNVQKGLVWLGLIGMADPIRKGIREVLGVLHQAGIDTVMITGDQSPTAYAIGKELNLSQDKQLEILDSTHLTDMDPEILKGLAERVHVFARVSPAHKLQIVQALQKAGKVVAMTGDGINDGPALKAADIGVAMGNTGTDVAREVADIILEDDNLETMIVAVSQGRTIYNNIRKSVRFLLATNLSEIMVMFVALTAGLGHPLNPMQLLWINLISDIFPGLALALEPPEPDILSRPPRNPEEPIIQTSDFKKIIFEAGTLSAGTLGVYSYGVLKYGTGPKSSTLAFTGLALGQLLHALSCRSEKYSLLQGGKLPSNNSLTIALGGSLTLQIFTLMIPGIRNLLGITPVSLMDGLVIGGGALFPLLINEMAKKIGVP